MGQPRLIVIPVVELQRNRTNNHKTFRQAIEMELYHCILHHQSVQKLFVILLRVINVWFYYTCTHEDTPDSQLILITLYSQWFRIAN